MFEIACMHCSYSSYQVIPMSVRRFALFVVHIFLSAGQSWEPSLQEPNCSNQEYMVNQYQVSPLSNNDTATKVVWIYRRSPWPATHHVQPCTVWTILLCFELTLVKGVTHAIATKQVPYCRWWCVEMEDGIKKARHVRRRTIWSVSGSRQSMRLNRQNPKQEKDK